MFRVLSILISTLFIAAIGFSLTEYKENLTSDKAIAYSRKLPERVTVNQAREELTLAKRAAHAGLGSARSQIHLASVLKRNARKEVRLEDQIILYCEALSAAGSAVKLNPLKASYLLNWADLRQILSDIECKEELTKGSVKDAVEYALKLDPRNPAVTYSAAVMLMRIGERPRALALLNATLLTETALSSSKREYVLKQITSKEDLENIIPARFPQIADWSLFIKEKRPTLFQRESFTISAMQLNALKEAVKEYELGMLPFEIHKQRLLSLLPSTASSAIRQTLDAELGRVLPTGLQESKLTKEYLLKRATLSELYIVRGVIDSDTRSETTPLSRWGADQNVEIDSFAQSVGFYLPSGQNVLLIELNSKGIPASGLSEMLRLLVSDDNQHWSTPRESYKTSLVELEDQKYLSIEYSGEYHRYWKINHTGQSRSENFGAPLQSLIKVYGRTNRKAEVPQ